MISIFFDDNGTLRRGFANHPLHNPTNNTTNPKSKEIPIVQCEACKETVGVVYIDPLSGKRFCDRCWRSPAMIKLRADGGYNEDGSKKIIPPIPFKNQQESSEENGLAIFRSNSISTLQRCESCHALCNDTTYVSNWGYVCSTCMTDYETTPTTTIHIRMKLKSSARSIAFFHYVMGNLDSDWPWASKPVFCSVCGGAKYVNPFFEAKDIKIIADNCKIGKIKISYIGEASKCEKNPNEVQAEVKASTELSAQTAADMQTILEGGHA